MDIKTRQFYALSAAAPKRRLTVIRFVDFVNMYLDTYIHMYARIFCVLNVILLI